MKGKRKDLWKAAVVGFCMLAIGAAGCSKEAQNGSESPKADKQKQQITISAYDAGNTPPEEGTIEKNRWVTWMSQNGPAQIKVISIPRTESVQKFNTLFASGSAPELIQEFSGPFRNQLYDQKLILPVDDLIEKHSTTYKDLLKQYPALKKAATMPDGKMYGFGRINGLRPHNVLMVRSDWLKKLNLQVPQTPEELISVLKAFRDNDPDGNGKKDTITLDMGSRSIQVIDSMFGNVGWVISGDKMVWDWDRAKAAAAFKKQLYDEGLIDKDYLTKKGSGYMGLYAQEIIAGKIGMWGSSVHQSDIETFKALKKADPNAELQVIPLPATVFGQFSPILSNPVQVTAMINADAKHPEAVMSYVDFMAAKETGQTLKYGVKGEDWKEGSNGCQQFIDKEKTDPKIKYTAAYTMLFSPIVEGSCGQFQASLNPSDPIEKQYLDLMKQAYDIYLDEKRPMPDFTHPEHIPAMPGELQTSFNNATKNIGDIWTKAIISGTSYTIDQAFQDAKSTWDKNNGKNIEEWYAKWYQDNKTKAFLTKDFYEFKLKF
ncbi:extracellular solute-binding protein [Paenibacillus sp. UNC451MF]|uniref:extracellular solute-binding protein n=1 Tax=Paenibacillus sp. UNC451MF TaxID=1449063 RepID=UPI00048DF074|nr:extracellular solute-binding protein [Paenibacillus sp. UNC451MF]